MPAAFPPTVAEREAELIALQSAFDEYIASSRELEEELDAELAKMQEKLAESTAANAALSAQLENIAPQLTSLENALTDTRRKLKEEQRMRRAAEQAQDEADQHVREMEMSLQHLREECDAVHEELAFKESELEETKLELEVEKQQLQNDLAGLQAELDQVRRSAARQQTSLIDGESTTAGNDEKSDTVVARSIADDTVPTVDDAYVKKLEEELELVTEQLIETEKRLSEAESELELAKQSIGTLKSEKSRDEDVEELVRTLQSENADRLEVEQRLREQLAATSEELNIVKEELALQQEELLAAEEDSKAAALRLEEERAMHRDEVNQLSIRVKEAEVASKNSLGEAAIVASTVKEAGEENAKLLEEVAALEEALKNAKADYQSVVEELEVITGRFDEARDEAARAAREEVTKELRSAMKSDSEHEIKEMKDQLEKLSNENAILQQKVDDAEMALATFKDSQRDTSGDAGSEVVKQLQSQLARAKEELAKKEDEISSLTATMEERITQAEQSVEKLESELQQTKGQLAESEAHLIVLRREKERNAIPKSPVRQRQNEVTAKGGPAIPSLDRSRPVQREELSAMDATPPKRRVRNRSRSTSPSSVMKLEYKLEEERKKFAELQKDYESLQDQKRMGEIRIKRLEDDLKLLQKELFSNGGDTAVTTQMSRLSSLATARHSKEVDLIADDEGESNRITDIIESRDAKRMAEELKTLQKKCNGQREYNAQLLSKMLHLQGNIQVYCRVRPMTLGEFGRGDKEIVEALSETEVGCFDSRSNKWKSFVFDRVWGPDQSQQSVFQDVEPLALSVVDGFNACIFAYGQTGSGKTYTMEGLEEHGQYGISYRTIQKIFHLLNLRAQQQRAAEMFVGNDEDENGLANEVAFTFKIQVGMLEIYNDEIYDLLGTEGASMAEKKENAMKAGGKSSLEIRRGTDGRIEVPNLTKENVESIKDVMELLKRGNANRATATTDMNEHSSRSHMVLLVEVASGLNGSEQNKGTLFLVDLAGSERVRKSNVEGDQLKEAGFINKSLSALGNVMEALDRKASHVPYRDSKLTYLLQDSIGGNSRTMMVVAICPTDSSYDESIHALQFATRVRRIQIGAAQRNVTSKNLEETVKSLTEEMRALTRAKERTESQLHSLKRDNARVQEKLQNISKSRAQTKTDTKTLEVLRKNNDDMAARWKKEKAAREEQAEELEKARKELRAVQQQLSKTKSKMGMLEKKLEDTEQELLDKSKLLTQERNQKSAASVRARRDQVLSAGNPTIAANMGNPIAVSRSQKPPSTPSASDHKISNDDVTPVSPYEESLDEEVAEIRSKVLALLEEHDKGKVDRIDIIMEKFKGKEHLLLEKMTQRYEGDLSSHATSVQKRNEMALQRHQERMKRIREKKLQNGS